MNLNQWFDKALKNQEYIQSMSQHKENLEYILHNFEIPEEDAQVLVKLKEEELRVIAITEDWCGDAMVNIPILLKIAELADMDVRMILRDTHLELIDQYLTNGTSRAIPIFIFLNKEGEERAVWGPRAASVQAYVDSERAQLPDKDSENFADRQQEMYARMMKRYVEDKSVWKEIYQSILERLQ